MSEDEQRLAAVGKILQQPELYCICQCCGSICHITVLLRQRVACPSCNGYAFDPDAEAVKQQAQKLLVRGQQSVQDKDLS